MMSVYNPGLDEKYKVLIKRGEFIDNARLYEGAPRVVPYKIYYPSDDMLTSPVPVVIWSHGFGGNRDGAGFISRYLAGNGYVVVHPSHIGTDSTLWEGKPGHPWDILRKAKISRETTLHRFQDIPFLLDQLPVWAEENRDVGRLMDFERIGMSGHSFGALTAQVMAGQMFPGLDDQLTQIKEERFKAGILFSPVPIGHLIESDQDQYQAYRSIDLPLFHMTGTEDASPLKEFDYSYRFSIFDHSSSPSKYLKILNGGDHMIYNGTRGKLKENPKRERHEELIKLATIGFWDTYLKDNEAAREWIRHGGLENDIGTDGSLKMVIGS
jgi:dienelactone hydrolase